MEWLLAFAAILLVIIIARLATSEPKKDRLGEANQKIGELQSHLLLATNQLSAANSSIIKLEEEFKHLQHQKISGDVRLGQKIEQILPFLQDFPYKEDEIRGLFNPIDLIVFREDEVVFVEVKSGQAQLSEKQRQIRDNIKAGRCRFEVHRLNEKGIKIK